MMGTRRPTQRELCVRLGLADAKSIRRHRDNGMPTHSLELAADWFARHVTGERRRDRLGNTAAAFAGKAQEIVAELPLDNQQREQVLHAICEAWHSASGMNGLGWVPDYWERIGLLDLVRRIIAAESDD